MSAQTFKTPFSREYWRLAVSEFRNPRILIVAALITALRIAVRVFNIPVLPTVNISFGFFFNALGSMIYGPAVGALAGAVSDTLGYLLHPSGAYFFPFIFTEMMSSFLFGLFFYRSEITPMRTVWARFSVTVVCNLTMDPLIMLWFNSIMYGKSYALFTVPRLIKNIALFPAQSVLLILFLGVLLPITNRFKLTYTQKTDLRVQKRHIIALIILSIIAIALVLLYTYVYLPNK